jgi:5-methyltetrahydrofolate--homocysteine methyltransferase
VIADVDISDLVPFIDWTLFFAAWELKGRFPAILNHPAYGAAARDLYRDGRALLDQVIADRSISLGAVYGFWPANAVGEDLVLYEPAGPASGSGELVRFNMLRQQERLGDDKPNRSLVDFVAPREDGMTDYVGAFAVTAGHGVDRLVARYEAAHDDYHAIMVKAIADRLAEAYAEYLHKRVRLEWGYGSEESLSHDALIAERYRGIRPAFGYPACPDHSEKTKLFALLQAERAGMHLTENFAMTPAAAVSGLYFAHPEASYFDVGRIGRDQVADYARRKGVSVEQAERWLRPNLGYEPADADKLTERERVGSHAGI